MITLRRIFGASLAAALFAVSSATAQAPSGQQRLVGNWEGTLNVGASLRLAFELKADSAGGVSGTVTSIDQGGAKIPVTATATGDSVRIAIAAIRGAYTARLSARGDSMDGQWTQAGAPSAFPLKLGRVAQITRLLRPQEPKPPFPYRAEEVTFASAESGVTLAGTLTVPQGTGPFPAVVLVSGSGPQNRDEELLGHKPFAVLADHLTRRGIAVLRFDDRGVGKSTGRFPVATSEDFAEDVLGGVRFLKTRSEVAAGKIGVAGHSEGGLIAPMVAVQSTDVAFLVLLAGPGVPGDEILIAQGRLIAKAAGQPDVAIERTAQAQARMFAAVRAGGDSAAMVARLQAIADSLVAAMPEAERRTSGVTPQMMRQQVATISSPWFRYFITHDPRPTLRRVKVPVLAINGALDLQVPSQDNLRAIGAALREGGNTNVVTREFAGLNHLFQPTQTGSPSEYGTIETTMSPEVLDVIAGWITERFGAGK
jgi:pimeloyl-ACP methyl ester carboxylesterase